MENTAVEKIKTVTKEIAKVTAEVGTVIGEGIEAVANDVTKELGALGTVVVDSTKTVVSDTAESGKQVSRDARHAVAPVA